MNKTNQSENANEAKPDSPLVYDVGIKYFLAPISTLLADDDVSEIIIVGPDCIYIEKAGRLHLTEAKFPSRNRLEAAVNTIAQFCGKTITKEEPILDGRLPDGSRVCIVMPPVADGLISVNIRRFFRKAVHPEFLLRQKSVTAQALEFLELLVKTKQNVIISGGTGSGKTTLLNILSTWFDPDHRIIVIEDTRELQVQQSHVISMEAQPPDPFGHGAISIRDMFIASLRMRPDRIIVGEIRGSEAVDMIQAMNSGHGGTLATIHADSPLQACARLEVMSLMAELGIPIDALRRQIAMALNFLVQVSRLADGRRCITHISRVDYSAEKEGYTVEDIFRLRRDSKERLMLSSTGADPGLAEQIALYNLSDCVKLTRDLFRKK